MKKILRNAAVVLAVCGLAGCSMYSTHQYHHTSKNSASNQDLQKAGVTESDEIAGTSVGGKIRNSMDKADIVKMSRSLDKSPGHSTTWISVRNGTSYTVTPIKAISVGKNHFCRLYSLTAEKDGNKQETSGTACVGSDANWKDVN